MLITQFIKRMKREVRMGEGEQDKETNMEREREDWKGKRETNREGGGGWQIGGER